MKNKTKTLCAILCTCAVGAVMAISNSKEPVNVATKEETPQCASSNQGAASQWRSCTRVECMDGASYCEPLDLGCGNWNQGVCRKFLDIYSCS
jgi:hypothetical protein